MVNKIIRPEQADTSSGCLICGEALIYTSRTLVLAKCAYCGKEEKTNVFCINGHYLCDKCHSKDILELIEEICMESKLTDPVELAEQIFQLPSLHMHGPEYHSIVPGILVTTHGNSINNKVDSTHIKEAIRRGREIKGGACGFYGVCGAAVGVGIAYSIIHEVTPYSKEERGNVQ